jgi:hypothetical protein
MGHPSVHASPGHRHARSSRRSSPPHVREGAELTSAQHR